MKYECQKIFSIGIFRMFIYFKVKKLMKNTSILFKIELNPNTFRDVFISFIEIRNGLSKMFQYYFYVNKFYACPSVWGSFCRHSKSLIESFLKYSLKGSFWTSLLYNKLHMHMKIDYWFSYLITITALPTVISLEQDKILNQKTKKKKFFNLLQTTRKVFKSN